MLFEPLYVFIFLVKFGLLSGRLLGNSCLLGLRYVCLLYVPQCHFIFFSTPRFLEWEFLSDCAIS